MIEKIFNQNIWWQDKGLIEQDPRIAELATRKFHWRPEVIDEFRLDEFSVYTLRGPRQVGKTTALKILIKDLLRREDVRKEQVMYFSCDTIDDGKELVELLETYLSHTGKLNLGKERLYIFLDEITSVRDWQRGIKHLADLGRLSQAGMVLTGSNASDLRKGIERLPGRRGAIQNPDRLLLPLKFRQFTGLVHPVLAQKITNDIDIFSPDEKDMSLLVSLMPQLGELSVLFDQYLLTGGIMRAINEYFSKQEIGFDVYELYQQWFRGDIARAGRSERTARQIIDALMRISVSAFGWETVAKKTDVASHRTVSEYMEEMEDFFVLKTLYQIDIHTMRPRIKKLKKAYFLDPFIFWTLRGWIDKWLVYPNTITKALAGTDLKARLAEMVVANELFDRYDRYDWMSSNVHFWKNGGEIDFIIKRDGQLLPVEVKYQKDAGLADFKLMKKLGFKKGILVSKNTLEREDGFLIIPLELFLMTKQ